MDNPVVVPHEDGPFAVDVEEARFQLEQIETAYLKRWGWKSTSHTPGSYWLWTRDFDDYNKRWDEWNAKVAQTGKGSPHVPYGPVTCSKEHALTITLKCLDERPEEGDFDD